MKKIICFALSFVLLFCSCGKTHPDEIDGFNIEYAQMAVANYYAFKFIYAYPEKDIVFVDYDKEQCRGIFKTTEKFNKYLTDSGRNVYFGVFYVEKDSYGSYVAVSESFTDENILSAHGKFNPDVN